MLKVAVLIDHLETLVQHKDTTIALIAYGVKKGHYISIFHQEDVFLDNGTICCKAFKIKFQQNGFIKKTLVEVERILDFDVVLLRKDPPIDMRFQSVMSLLATLESKVLFVNSPTNILLFPEKIWPVYLGLSQPETLISSIKSDLIKFKTEHNCVVLKPLYNYCGNGVYISLNKDKNFVSVLESLLDISNGLPIICQKYLKGVENGDRRILMLGGKPVGAINRVACENDYRCNMKNGGNPELHTISMKEKMLCDSISSLLIQHGLQFVGIDIIEDYITEINTTAPTGLVQIRNLGGTDISENFWDYIEKLHHDRKYK